MYIPHVTSVTTNLKGPRRNIVLGPKTLLIGPNESGKSAITQSLQLALTGAASSLLFRGSVKLGDYLLTMGDDTGLAITAEVSGGAKASYVATPGKRPKREGAQATAISIEDVRTAFSGSTDRLREFVLQHAKNIGADPAATMLTDLLARMHRDIAPDVEARAQYVPALSCRALASLIEALETHIKGLSSGMKEQDILAGLLCVASSSDYDTKTHAALIGLGMACKARSEAIKIETGHYKEAVTVLSTALDKDMIGMYDWLQNEVTKYLLDGERFNIDRANGWAGIIHGRKVHTALSGSTEARVLAALVAALTEPGELGLLVMDDRMWDGGRLAAVMEALANAPCQVIITSTIYPDHPVAGWACCELGAPEPSEDADRVFIG